jgi:hypothetical protein
MTTLTGSAFSYRPGAYNVADARLARIAAAQLLQVLGDVG